LQSVEEAETGHPFGVLTNGDAMNNLDRERRRLYAR
jgi:hypothetical protein